MRTALLGATLILLSTFAARAQIVNVLPAAARDADGVSASGQVGVDWRTGATDLQLLSGGARLAYRRGRHTAILIAEGETGERAGERFASHQFQHLRYRGRLAPWLHAEAFAQRETNEFRRLALRGLLGMGLRAERRLEDAGLLALGVAYMPERERLRDGPEPDAGAKSSFQRLSSYASLQWTPSKGVTLSHTSFVQPRLNALEDWRALSETSVTAPVSARVSLRLSLTVTHDSTPPAGINKTDTRTRTAVSVSL